MRILGIDPGFDRLGLAVIDSASGKLTVVWSACVEPPKGTPETRLACVYSAVYDALEKYTPTALSIETLFFSTNKKTALKVAEARGVILAAAGARGVRVFEHTPNQVKLAVAGNGSADKSSIERMIPHLVTFQSSPLGGAKKKDDEVDAIAVAITGCVVIPALLR